jgi:ubiquinone/menaquinone biosynthesis C-methylase UbiE
MRQDDVARKRGEVVPAARGAVLEIGIGSAMNLRFYGPDVSSLSGIDTSKELLDWARPKAAAAAMPVLLARASAQALPFIGERFDTVVVTWSLCSVADPRSALAEARRVLKTGGSLIFIEHGLAPDASVRGWQRRLTPLWRNLAGGCHLDRSMDVLIREAGFHINELETGYIPGPRFATFMYQGHARK